MMKELEDFKTLEELLQYKKELETRVSDDDILEEVLENIWVELLNASKLEEDVYDISKINKNWLITILTLLNKRNDNKFGIRILNDSKKQKKIYKLDNSLNQAVIDEYNIDKEHNLVQFVDDNGLTYTYDSFYGEFCLEDYLEKEKNFGDIVKLYNSNLFTEKEKRVLNKYVYDEYLESIHKNKSKVRK